MSLIDRRMNTPHRSGAISRPTLLWLVVAGFLIVSGVGTYFAVVRHSASPPAPPGAPINLNGPPPPTNANGDQFQGSTNGVAQSVDKDDPTRLAREFRWKKLDPLPKGLYSIEGAELWLFLKDGRTVVLHAAKGTIKLIPGSKRPESGRFFDGVVVRIFDAKPEAAPGSRVDPEKDAPSLLAYTPTVTFDTSVGEFAAPGIINISTMEFETQGRELDVVYNEIRERLDSLAMIGEYMHAYSGPKPASAKTVVRASAPPPPQPVPNGGAKPEAALPSPSGAAPTKAPIKEDMYAVEFTGPIKLDVGATGARSVSSDRLLVWARLLDNKLPQDAIAEIGPKRTPKPNAPTPNPNPSQPPADSAAIAKAPADDTPKGPSPRERLNVMRSPGPSGLAPITPIGDDDVVLTWNGQLTAHPVESAPPELAKDHVAVRFVADGTNKVVLADGKTGASVQCGAIEYGATTADTNLASFGSSGVVMTDAKGGRGEFPQFQINLATGIAHVPGAGSLAIRKDPKPGAAETTTPTDEQRISWTDQADFTFSAMNGGPGVEAIREAMFTGQVTGSDSKSAVSGDFMHVWLNVAGQRNSVVTRVTVEGQAHGRTLSQDEPQGLRADAFDLTFAPTKDGRSSAPKLLVATGHVDGTRTELIKDPASSQPAKPRVSTLKAGGLEAQLQADDRGRTVVSDARATGGASFERSDGISAQGADLHADVAAKTVDVTGPSASVTRGGSTLYGTDLTLDGLKNSLLVRSPGRIHHTDAPLATPASEGSPEKRVPHKLDLTWTKGLRFDDSTGEGECLGQAEAVYSTLDNLEVDTVRGEKLTLRTAKAGTAPKAAGAEALDSTLKNRNVLSAEVIAPEPTPGQTTRATIESRRYVADPSAANQRRLEQLMYIEGARLIADQEHGVFSCPAPGKALVLDQRAVKPEQVNATPGTASSPIGPTNSRGSSLFTWGGSMTMDRGAGKVTMNTQVRISHKPLGEAARMMTLDADHVDADLKMPEDSKGAPDKGQLLRATARGSVHASTEGGDQELDADEALWDEVNHTIEAWGVNGNKVSLLDKRKGVPVIAKKLRWRLDRPGSPEEIEIIEMMPISTPR